MENKDDLLAALALDIVRAANLMERLGGNYAREGNLDSVKQYMILSMLASSDGLSMGELRENTLVTKQAVTGLVDRLKKGGYIETDRDPNDRRVTRVHLTAEGRNVLQAIRPKRIDGNREAFSVLEEKELIQLTTILSKLISHLVK